MISRRDFLETVARVALTVGGAGIILSDPFWQRYLIGDDAGLAFGGQDCPTLRFGKVILLLH